MWMIGEMVSFHLFFLFPFSHPLILIFFFIEIFYLLINLEQILLYEIRASETSHCLLGKSYYKHSETLSFSCLPYFYDLGICKLCMGVDVLPSNE